jgi:hypothetical protein
VKVNPAAWSTGAPADDVIETIALANGRPASPNVMLWMAPQPVRAVSVEVSILSPPGASPGAGPTTTPALTGANAAVTLCAALMATWQVPVPVQ